MHGPSDNSLAYKAPPSSRGEWTELWTREKEIEVPTREGRRKRLQIARIEPVMGDLADLYIETACNRSFYVHFNDSCVINPLDKPLLVWRAASDYRRAVWVI